ncbi:uncharacterized protein [Diabrotica undecimpunctata]|uniref:uncharacterized protein n=1 Tax=Diabrotica undecimpunctata TaxID=50387 RepID=UPI003B633442
MYIPNKPKKYGIKLFTTIDAKSFYANMEIYASQQPSGPYKVDNSCAAVITRMYEPLYGTEINITMDRWFVNCSLVLQLTREHRLTVVSTTQSQRKGLPPIMTNVKHRPVSFSIFGFGAHMMVISHVLKKYKNVLLVSSFHHSDTVAETSKSPEMILFYSDTKCLVDIVDKM